MSEINTGLSMKEFIEQTIINSKGNSENLSANTLNLLKLTSEKCFNCLSGEWSGLKGDYYSIRSCMNPNSPLQGSFNSITQSCSHHE